MTDQNKEESIQEEPLAAEQAADLTAGDAIPSMAEELQAAGGEAPETATDDVVVQLVQEIKEAIKARDDWEDRYLRAAAAFANARRRAELRYACEMIVSITLRVMTSLTRSVRSTFKALAERDGYFGY